jgi:hypothetical protein
MLKYKRHIIFFIIIIAVSNCVSAQNKKPLYKFEWNEYFDNHSMEQINSLCKTGDGNIMLAGISKHSKPAVWLIKINLNGKKIWTKEFTGYPLMHPAKIIRTFDNNYIIGGTIAQKNSAPHKIWLMKINRNGHKMWERTYKGIGDAYCSDIIETMDSNIVVCGYSSENTDSPPDWYIMETDSIGLLKWDRTFGTRYDDRALSVTQLFDSSLVIVGYISYSEGGYKRATVSKINTKGIDLNYFELRYSNWSTANSVTNSSDSAFVMITEIKKSGLLHHIIKIIKMSVNGDTIWTRNLPLAGRLHPVSIIETYDQGYAVAFTDKKNGLFRSNIGILKLSPQGDIAWLKIFKRRSEDYAAQIIEAKDNALVVGATDIKLNKGSNYGVVKYKSIEMSDMFFVSPTKKLLTVYNPFLKIDAFITGYKKPKNVKIYLNRKLISVEKNLPLSLDEIHKYLLKKDLKLQKGQNIIDFVVTDYKNYVFVKTLHVYYLPSPATIW